MIMLIDVIILVAMSVCLFIVQNLTEILHLPGVEDQTALRNDINVQIIGYKAFKYV